MKVGDLVRIKEDYFTTNDEDWIGLIVDFKIRVDSFGEPVERYAVVCWNEKFHEEEEYVGGLEVVG